MRSLDLWISDLLKRYVQLNEWCGNPNEIPKVTWLSGLIIPESFLTAIKQVGCFISFCKNTNSKRWFNKITLFFFFVVVLVFLRH